jgi:hypothetical protein
LPSYVDPGKTVTAGGTVLTISEERPDVRRQNLDNEDLGFHHAAVR